MPRKTRSREIERRTSGNKLIRIRSPFGRKGGNLAGVCEGLAAYFDTEPMYFRLGFIASTFFSGLGIVIYLALTVVLPDEKGGSLLNLIQEQLRKDKTPKQKFLEDDLWEEDHFQLCDNCDTVVKYGSKFCHHCGNKL